MQHTKERTASGVDQGVDGDVADSGSANACADSLPSEEQMNEFQMLPDVQ